MGESVPKCVRRALPCGHDTDYTFCQITFKLHMSVVDDKRRNPIDFGSRGQRSRSTLVKVNFGQGQLWHSVYKILWTRYRLQF